jgi:hypothetical protein
MDIIYLSRRNLLTLLSKLDRCKEAGGKVSECTIIKHDNRHPKYPQSMPAIKVVTLEDEEYYVDRRPGEVHPFDETNLNLVVFVSKQEPLGKPFEDVLNENILDLMEGEKSGRA